MSDDKIKVTWNDIEKKSNSNTMATLENPASRENVSKRHRNTTWTFIGIFAGLILGVVIISTVAKSDYKRPIEAVLNANKNLTKNLDTQSVTEKVNIIVERMRSINLSDCPEDFQDAYLRHIEAWSKAIPLIEAAEEMNGSENLLKNIIIGFVGGYTGQFHLVADKIMSDINTCNDLKAAVQLVDAEIKNTFHEVLRIAQKYKVDTTTYLN